MTILSTFVNDVVSFEGDTLSSPIEKKLSRLSMTKDRESRANQPPHMIHAGTQSCKPIIYLCPK